VRLDNYATKEAGLASVGLRE
jgi:hypothetical protein